jgi:hypothetical protein
MRHLRYYLKIIVLSPELCQYLLYKYLVYSTYISIEVSDGTHDADIAMGYGFSWLPPSAIIEFFGGVDKIIFNLSKNRFRNRLNMTDIEIKNLLKMSCKSKIDYRRFIKAKC